MLHWQKQTPLFAAFICLRYGFFFLFTFLRELFVWRTDTYYLGLAKRVSTHCKSERVRPCLPFSCE